MTPSHLPNSRHVPVVGTPAPDGVSCQVCHDTRYVFDSDGHGGFSWKRPCRCCYAERVPKTEETDRG